MDVCLLVSGKLGFIILVEIVKTYSVRCVLTDKHSEEIIAYCKGNDISCFAGNPRNGKVSGLVDSIQVDILLSVNYIYLIDSQIINWPSKYAINIHGSLLPKFRGRTPHVWAIINNENETGITAHLIDEGCDTGPVIKQVKIAIQESDTGASILEKYKELYPELVLEVLAEAAQGNLIPTPQDHSKATFYSKRTPEDGQINWEWQKERILNWVRALAYPYPGAFTYYQENKIKINKVSFSDHGYIDSIPNGTIIAIKDGKPVVKIQNGAIKVLELDPIPELKITEKFYGKH